MTSFKNGCPPGFVALQQQACPDISAVGIKNIYQSLSDPSAFYIVLTNGTSYPINIPAGAKGATGATGATGQAGATGLSGTSLIHSGPVVGGIIQDVSTSSSSATVVDSFTTDKTNSAHNLVNIGDTIRLKAKLTLAANPIQNLTLITASIIVNGTGLSNVVVEGVFEGSQSGAASIDLTADVILSNNASGAMTCRVIGGSALSQAVTSGANPLLFNQPAIGSSVINSIGGATVDFSTNNYTFSVSVIDESSTAVILKSFMAEKLSV